MITKVTAKVTAVSEQHEYYPLTGKYIQSKLSVADNPAHISGELTVREKLELGAFYSVIVNTDKAVDKSLPLTADELKAA
jgi:hypothetical protein